ncbi:MAG: inorganic pyrophosphatase [Bryobacterales bacterium]|nr:inorganic pyrophosphatase [Bryobacterales bacterium]
MEAETPETLWNLMSLLFKPHPWHGIGIGRRAPAKVTCYIEIVPTDTVKFEIDKVCGYLKLDRPQKYSNFCPALYGFIPQTYCGDEVAEMCNQRTGRTDIVGDGDPLDICVLTEKEVMHGDIILEAIPIGGLRMIDGNEADDKIIAVLNNDAVYGEYEDLENAPFPVIERLRHYFLTYKDTPGSKKISEVTHVYNRKEAHEVIRRSIADYQERFGALAGLMQAAGMTKEPAER